MTHDHAEHARKLQKLVEAAVDAIAEDFREDGDYHLSANFGIRNGKPYWIGDVRIHRTVRHVTLRGTK